MIKILYFDIPSGANEEAIPEGLAQPFWDGTLDGTGEKAAATLESGGWRLDGSKSLLDGNPRAGFWSNAAADAQGQFPVPVELSLILNGRYTATGLTLTFDESENCFATRFRVAWYRGQNCIAEGEYGAITPMMVLNREVDAFDRIQLTFYALNRPGRFLRMSGLKIGVTAEFGSDELQDCRMEEETDILSTQLSGNTLSFTLMERKGRVLQFQKRQPFEVWRKGTRLGRFYLEDCSKTQRNVYRISAQDGVGILADSQWEGGIYRDVGFSALVDEILDGELPYEMDAALEKERLSGWLAPGSKRDALMQAAFAAGAMVTNTPEGGLRFSAVPGYSEKILPGNVIFTGGSIRSKPKITRVLLVSHDYQPGTVPETVAEETVTAGEMTFLMKKPYGNYTVEGGQLLKSGANRVTVLANGGPLKIEAVPYLESTRTLTWENPETVMGDQSNQLEISEATLVDWNRAEQVLNRVSRYASNRQELRQTVVGIGPEPGKMITSEMPFDGQLVGYVTGRTLRLSGGAVAEITVVGRNLEMETVDAGISGIAESGVTGWN